MFNRFLKLWHEAKEKLMGNNQKNDPNQPQQPTEGTPTGTPKGATDPNAQPQPTKQQPEKPTSTNGGSK